MNRKENFTKEQKIITSFIGLSVDIFVSHYNFRKLFEDERTHALLKSTASDFFHFLNELLINDFFLKTARLLEGQNFKDDKNITVDLIVNLSIWNDEQKTALYEYKNVFDGFYKKIKKARSKIIAHNDLKIYEDDSIEFLGEFEVGLDQEFINALEQFCNYIHKEVFGEIWGEFVPSSPTDVQELIGYLYRGEVFHQVIEDHTVSVDVKTDLMQRLIKLQRRNDER